MVEEGEVEEGLNVRVVFIKRKLRNCLLLVIEVFYRE
jgi:hypothetical protein